jgi:anti-sigma B factor antagonist
MPRARPHVEPFADGLVLTLRGELDAYDAPALRASFADATAHPSRVVVLDLAAVSFLDSTVLGTIVGLQRRVREASGELRVVLPESDGRRAFELTGLDRALEVRTSRESALSG